MRWDAVGRGGAQGRWTATTCNEKGVRSPRLKRTHLRDLVGVRHGFQSTNAKAAAANLFPLKSTRL